MTIAWVTAEWIVFGVWAGGGLVGGIVAAVIWELDFRKELRKWEAAKRDGNHLRYSKPEANPPAIGAMVWAFFPLFLVAAALTGLWWVANGGVGRLADRVEGRQRKQDELQTRIDELERELELAA